MRTLTLIRHAKSSWKHFGLTDLERPLNSRGERDAPRMGSRLAEAGLQPDLMVSSPAVRAMATSRFFADALGYPLDRIREDPSIYAAGLRDLVDVVHSLDPSSDTVCMVGHNPGFTELAGYLTGNPAGHLPTCGIVHILWQRGSWAEIARGSGSQIFFDYPKNDGPVTGTA